MTGLISGIKRNAVHDGPGIRTTVFLKGCPLRCVWCHNPESISFSKELGFYKNKCISCGSCAVVCPNGAVKMIGGYPVTDSKKCIRCFSCAKVCPGDARTVYGEQWNAADLALKLAEDRNFFDVSGGGVTISGGECLSQPDFTAELAEILSEEKISVCIDTCGYAPRDAFDAIMPYTELFLYDIKAIDPDVHRRCTGKDNQPILANLRYLSDSGCRIEIRYPYVPGWNDRECEAMAVFLNGMPGITKVKVLGYHNMAGGKYAALSIADTLPEIQPTAAETEEAVEIFKRYGVCAVNGMTDD